MSVKRIIQEIGVILVAIFMFIPIVLTVLVAFSQSETFEVSGFSFQWFIEAFNSESFMKAMLSSFVVAIIATLLALLISLLAASSVFKNRKLVKWQFLLDSPMLIPNLVLSFVLYQIFVVRLMVYEDIILILAHTVVLLPFAFRSFTAILLKMDYNLFLAAKSLGMKERKVFWKVIVPNMKNAIVAIGFISFINSFNNLAISYFLTKTGMMLVPSLMLSHLQYYYDPLIAAISVVIIAITVIILVFVEKVLKFSLMERR